MIDYQTYHQIRHLRQQGLTAGQIAGELKLDERTVRAWMDEDKYQPRHSSKRPSKLDAYRQEIIRSLQTHPFTARQILHRVKENGYTGGYSILKEFVASVRPPKQEAFLTLTFAPGECAQVDWGCAGSIPVGNTNRRLSFFVMVLCHSRRLFLEFTLTERLEQFLACHQNAFRYFGGVPEKVMVDNLKSAVLSHPFGQPAQYHPRYLDFAGHYGFEVKACNVRKPNEKGRVENAVAYVKKNFLSGLELKDFPAIQTAGRLWQDEVANRRVHAVTRRVPDEMFNEEKLQPLPTAGVYDAGVIKETMASAQFRVAYDGNRYSVPAEYAGHRVSLRAYSDRLAFYHDGKLIAEHLRSYQRGRDVLNPDHEKELLQQRRQGRNQRIYQRFLQLTPQADEYHRQLAERRLNPRHHVGRIVALSEIYGFDKTARAIQDAMEFGAFSSEYIANILEQQGRLLPEPGALHVTRGSDLLDLELPETDLSVYTRGEE
jgi:transposase